jgi:hypothetical protein
MAKFAMRTSAGRRVKNSAGRLVLKDAGSPCWYVNLYTCAGDATSYWTAKSNFGGYSWVTRAADSTCYTFGGTCAPCIPSGGSDAGTVTASATDCCTPTSCITDCTACDSTYNYTVAGYVGSCLCNEAGTFTIVAFGEPPTCIGSFSYIGSDPCPPQLICDIIGGSPVWRFIIQIQDEYFVEADIPIDDDGCPVRGLYNFSAGSGEGNNCLGQTGSLVIS